MPALAERQVVQKLALTVPALAGTTQGRSYASEGKEAVKRRRNLSVGRPSQGGQPERVKPAPKSAGNAFFRPAVLWVQSGQGERRHRTAVQAHVGCVEVLVLWRLQHLKARERNARLVGQVRRELVCESQGQVLVQSTCLGTIPRVDR